MQNRACGRVWCRWLSTCPQKTSRRRCGTGPLPGTAPSWSRDRQSKPNYSVDGISGKQLHETAAGTKETLVHPHKPPQPQDSRGFSLTGSAQGWPRAAGIITASILESRCDIGWSVKMVFLPRAFHAEPQWVGHRGLARDGLVRFVLRSHLAHKLEVNQSICSSPRLFRIAVEIRRQSLSC